MSPFRSIIAATDFSVDGNNAVRRAMLLARQHEARLTVLHVIDEAAFPPVREWLSVPLATSIQVEQAQVMLHRLIRDVSDPRDTPVAIDVQTDNSLCALLRASEQSDLLVLGQRPGNRFKALLLGHTAHRVVEQCRGPVLVVKRSADVSYQRVLVPFDFTPVSDSAAVLAATLAPDIDLQFFHALGVRKDVLLRHASASAQTIRAALELEDEGIVARMRRKIARLGLDNREMSFGVERGLADSTILQQGSSRQVELMVVGRESRSRTAEMLLGSTSGKLLKRSACDILIVPRCKDRQMPAAVRGAEAMVDSPRLSRSTAAFAKASCGNWMSGSSRPRQASSPAWPARKS